VDIGIDIRYTIARVSL